MLEERETPPNIYLAHLRMEIDRKLNEGKSFDDIYAEVIKDEFFLLIAKSITVANISYVGFNLLDLTLKEVTSVRYNSPDVSLVITTCLALLVAGYLQLRTKHIDDYRKVVLKLGDEVGKIGQLDEELIIKKLNSPLMKLYFKYVVRKMEIDGKEKFLNQIDSLKSKIQAILMREKSLL